MALSFSLLCFLCSCGKRFATEDALQRHRRATRHDAAAQPDTEQLSDDGDGAPVVNCDEEFSRDEQHAKTERDIDDIAEEFLDECTELRYEQYISPANVQRVKGSFNRITSRQTAAVKRVLEQHVSRDVNLDELIDPIMKATQRYSTEKREARGRLERQSFNITPIKRSLGTHPIEYDVGGGVMEERDEELFTYDIPIEQSLQREMLYNATFAEHMQDWGARPANPDGSYTSMQDGSASENHPMLGNTSYVGPSRLAFAHYYDDVEVVNPLGAARTKHKLALHYVQLLNPPPHIRSDLDVIFLVSVALKKSQDAVGISRVVQGAKTEARDGSSLGASLRRFDEEHGIAFERRDGTQQAFRGWLLLVSADTLAAAELIGFKKSYAPRVKSICWQCDVPGGQGSRHPCSFHGHGSRPFTLRTSADYRRQRREAKTKAAKARISYQDSIGVNSYQHAYTRIPYFDVISYVPRDLMHVELEGNLKVHLYGFLYMAIKKYKWFTRAELNARIRAFPFLSKVRRPPVIPATTLKGRTGILPSGKGSIPYTSGQMLHFVLHSLELFKPLLRRHPSSFQSPEYLAWVAHVRYFAALMKPSFTEETIANVDQMIFKAQTLFLSIPAYSQLWKPKNHFAQHFPGDIKRFGPPRTYWCMRFEAKNQDHKRAAKTGNFKNAPGTVAQFYAARSAHRLAKKRKHTLFSAEPGQATVKYAGTELTVGMWVIFKRPGPSREILGQISSVAHSDGTIYGVNIETFDLSSVLHDDSEGGLCAHASDLVKGEFVSLSLQQLEYSQLTTLLPVKHEDSVWFVEQP